MLFNMNWTLPHIAYHCSCLGQYMHDPSPDGMEALLVLIIYCYFNRDNDVITFLASSFPIPSRLPDSKREIFLKNFGTHGFCDASWLLRSIGGYVIMMCGGPIDWSSKMFRVICHSSSEAEIGAGCFLGKRTVFVRQYISEFHVELKGPFIIFIDNSAALDISKKLGVGTRTAHFLRWQHYLRWLVIHHYVELIFVGTAEQLADIFTKSLDMSTFLKFCRILFVRRS